MQELTADPVLVEFGVNQAHTVAKSAAPSGSAYSSANVCCVPDPLPGITDTGSGPEPAAAWIVVLSLALAVSEPPPDTLTEFACGELAVSPTFTVTVIAG